MHFDVGTTTLICFLVFLAGFIDAIAGGGGLISLPAYIFANLPPHMAYGTNKFSSTVGTIFSTFRFIKSGNIHYPSAMLAAAGALIGSFIGAKAALALDEIYLRYCLLVLLPLVALFVIFNRGFGEKSSVQQFSAVKVAALSSLSGLLIGAYDGFFGPGTGTFLILAFTSVIGLNITKASGNAKIVNLASNISAAVTFLISGKIIFAIGIPAALSGILGHWLGSGLAIKNGAKIIKPAFILVLGLLFAKICSDFFNLY